jgi:hypothetical protein
VKEPHSDAGPGVGVLVAVVDVVVSVVGDVEVVVVDAVVTVVVMSVVGNVVVVVVVVSDVVPGSVLVVVSVSVVMSVSVEVGPQEVTMIDTAGIVMVTIEAKGRLALVKNGSRQLQALLTEAT